MNDQDDYIAEWIFIALVLLLAAVAVYALVPIYNPAWGLL